MPERVDTCVRSIQNENEAMDESTARAICTKMENEGKLEAYLNEHLADPPEGPALAMHALQEPGRITREERGDDTVVYKDIMLIAPGVWKDAASGEPIYYSPRGLKNAVQNVTARKFNFLHERQDELWEVGHFENEYADEDGRIFADVVLNTGKTAGQLADEALEAALQTGGNRGVEGPSIEIMGNRYEFDLEKGVREVVDGEINGAGLVGIGITPGPASKSAAFGQQTAERGVALADGDVPERILTLTSGQQDYTASTVAEGDDSSPPPKVFEMAQGLLQDGSMDKREVADIVADTWESLSADDVLEVLEDASASEDEDDEDEDDQQQDAATDDEDDDGEDESPETDEGEDDDGDEGQDLAGQVMQAIEQLEADVNERLSSLKAELEQLQNENQDLAESEAIQELQERISTLEDRTQEPQSLADGGTNGDGSPPEGDELNDLLLQETDPKQPEVSVRRV